MHVATSSSFKENAHRALGDAGLQRALARSGSSFISNNDMRVHFGLGAATKIDSVEVRWPSGLVEHFDNLSVDAIHALKEGSGVAGATPSKNPEQGGRKSALRVKSVK